jgi:hypothetical protein
MEVDQPQEEQAVADTDVVMSQPHHDPQQQHESGSGGIAGQPYYDGVVDMDGRIAGLREDQLQKEAALLQSAIDVIDQAVGVGEAANEVVEAEQTLKPLGTPKPPFLQQIPTGHSTKPLNTVLALGKRLFEIF